jgi:hypothetical protein
MNAGSMRPCKDKTLWFPGETIREAECRSPTHRSPSAPAQRVATLLAIEREVA